MKHSIALRMALQAASLLTGVVVHGGLQPAECADAKTYLTWLDPAKSAFAYVNRSEQRVIFGFARAQDAPRADQITRVVPRESGTPAIRLDQIDTGFQDYVRSASSGAKNFEVWNVKLPASPESIRMAMAGRLILVESPNSEPTGKAENALLAILFHVAESEKKKILSLPIQGLCAEAGTSISEVIARPFSVGTRDALLAATVRPLSTSVPDSSSYSISNDGLLPAQLRMNLTPRSDLRYLAVKYETGAGRQDVTVPDSRLMVPPCQVALVSIASRSFFRGLVFRSAPQFELTEGDLKVQIAPVRAWILWTGGFVAILGLAFAGKRIRRRKGSREDFETGVSATNPSGATAAGAGKKSKHGKVSDAAAGDKPKRRWWPSWSQGSVGTTPPEPDPGSVDKTLAEARQLVADLRETQDLSRKAAELTKVKLELEGWKKLEHIGVTPDKVLDGWGRVWGAVQSLPRAKSFVKPNERPSPGDIVAPLSEWGKTFGETLQELEDLEKRKQSLDSALIQYGALFRSVDSRVSDSLSVDEVVRRNPEAVASVSSLRAFVDSVAAGYAKELNVSVEVCPTSTDAIKEAEKLRSWIEIVDRRKKEPAIRRVEDLIGSLSHAASSVRGLEIFDGLLADTRMAPSELAAELATVADALQKMLKRALLQNITCGSAETVDLQKVSLAIITESVRGQNAMALTNMLRLRQSMDAYFKGSPDEDAALLFEEGAFFRDACDTLLGDFGVIGLRFHPVRFLEAVDGRAWNAHTITQSLPYLHRNKKLREVIRKGLESRPEPWNTVADVDQWGFECKLDSTLSRQTQLWLWLAGALQTAGMG